MQMRDGWGRIDVHSQIATDDRALLYVRYQGWVQPTAVLQDAVARRVPTRFQDQLICTIWQIESGGPTYAWVNRAIFVGEGRLLPGPGEGQLGMEHLVFRCA
jgi:hypothetical protein